MLLLIIIQPILIFFCTSCSIYNACLARKEEEFNENFSSFAYLTVVVEVSYIISDIDSYWFYR